MLIGVCGAICAGKKEVARYLVTKYDFKVLNLVTEHATSSIAPPLARTPEPRLEDRHMSIDAERHFQTASDLLDFATKNFDKNYVTWSIPDEETLDLYSQRPFFLLISVDAPVTIRWKRYKQKYGHVYTPNLEEFLRHSDIHMYHQTKGLMPLVSRASLHLINFSDDLNSFHASLEKLNLTDKTRLRPSWDAYFMQLASLAAKRANCMKRRVGCVLVRSGRVIATGYNGVPRGMKNCADGGCERCNGTVSSGASLSTCLCLHAEENALLEAGRERVGDGAVLYCDTCPCLTCAIKIVQVGIQEVVYRWGYSMDEATARVMREGGVKLRQFSPPRDGLVNLGEEASWMAGVTTEVLSATQYSTPE